MRTTIDIDAVLLRDLKRLKRSEDKTLGAIVNELLASALAARHQSVPRKGRFRLRTFDMGKFRVDLEDKQKVQTMLDDEDFLR